MVKLKEFFKKILDLCKMARLPCSNVRRGYGELCKLGSVHLVQLRCYLFNETVSNSSSVEGNFPCSVLSKHHIPLEDFIRTSYSFHKAQGIREIVPSCPQLTFRSHDNRVGVCACTCVDVCVCRRVMEQAYHRHFPSHKHQNTHHQAPWQMQGMGPLTQPLPRPQGPSVHRKK